MTPFSSPGRSDVSAMRNAVVPAPSDHVDARPIAANVAEVHAIPAGARVVLFSASGDFFAKFGSSSVNAEVPAAAVTDGSAPELNPAARRIPDDATHVALVSPADCSVTLSWYAD